MKKPLTKVLNCLVITMLLVVLKVWDGSASGGASWQTELVDNAGNVGRFANMALDANGYPHIAYQDITNRNLKYTYYDGSTWHIETVQSAWESGYEPSLELDANGLPHIAWCQGLNVMYGYHDGSTWHIQTVSSGLWPKSTSLALDSSGSPHISWFTDVEWGSNPNALMYSWYDGTWHSSKVDGPSFYGIFTSIVVDSQDHPHIAYSHVSDRALKYAWYDSTWHIETVYSDGQIYGPVALTLDSSDHPRVAHQDSSRSMMEYFWNDGSSWHKETIGSAVITLFSIALDSMDNTHVSYTDYDGTNYYIKYAYQNSGTWHIETVNLGSTGSLALDASDVPHISYYVAPGGLWYATRRVSVLATVDIDPDTFNLKSKGKWITAYIELPDDYDVADIDVSTVMLEGTIPAENQPTQVGDYDSDGIPDLMVKFDRQTLNDYLDGTIGEVTLLVNGELDGGTLFEGSDLITVIDP